MRDYKGSHERNFRNPVADNEAAAQFEAYEEFEGEEMFATNRTRTRRE